VGLNASGNVTGIAARADGERHAFIYSAAKMTDLGTLGGTLSIGYAINDSNQVTGEAAIAGGVFHAFVYANGQMVDLDPAIESLGFGTVIESVGFDINSAGQVIGRLSVSDPSDVQIPVRSRAFIATPISSLFDSLLDEVQGVGPGKSLAKKVQKASKYYASQDGPRTCTTLSSFISEVNAQTGKKVGQQTALRLVADAGAIKAAIHCQ
jgi:probable HAF family extracellular repeat protein